MRKAVVSEMCVLLAGWVVLHFKLTGVSSNQLYSHTRDLHVVKRVVIGRDPERGDGSRGGAGCGRVRAVRRQAGQVGQR